VTAVDSAATAPAAFTSGVHGQALDGERRGVGRADRSRDRAVRAVVADEHRERAGRSVPVRHVGLRGRFPQHVLELEVERVAVDRELVDADCVGQRGQPVDAGSRCC
jgi:hypothetical protein